MAKLSQTRPLTRYIAYTDVLQSPIVIALLLGLIALMPRVWGLADFLTTDEAYHWIKRTEQFSAAIVQQNWGDTIQTGHPGVTTMWLGSLGLIIERVALSNGWINQPSLIEHLAWLRLPSAWIETLIIPIAYLLLRRLVTPSTALITALLWAISPYLIAHARVLHMDALLTTWVTLSILLLLLATKSENTSTTATPIKIVRWPVLIASGVCAGLALLTKGPALILLPIAGLLVLWRIPTRPVVTRVWHSIRIYFIWLIVAAVIIFMLWPALWVDPTRALERYIGEIVSNGGRPNGDGQFFLGQAVGDPGPLFYPLANLFRMTPLTLIGLLLLPLALMTPRSPTLTNDQVTSSTITQLRQRQTLLALGAFILFWTVVMTFGPKKFDRYVLPTWPALLVLAGAGWATGLHWLSAQNSHRFLAWLKPHVVVFTMIIFGLGQVLWYHPYYLSYYNPLLGGGQVAQQNFLIGWGEGMDQIGKAIQDRPDVDQGAVLSALPPTLQPFVSIPVKSITEFGQSPDNYAIVYLESIQRGAHPEIYDRIQQTVPVERITIHDIDYATIHQLPKPFAQPISATFDETLHLRGVTIEQTPEQTIVTPSWDVRGSIEQDYMLFLHLLDTQGHRVAQVDVAPGGGDAFPTSEWQPGQQIAVPINIGIPSDIASGSYQLVLGMYDPTTNTRIPFEGGTVVDPQQAGPHVLFLDLVIF
ncbi:MAG: phospholipid carrier-dependent glycosyltransferase [Chloroflexota bacterium]